MSGNSNFSTLVELLRYRAQTQANEVGYVYLRDGKSDEIGLTYAELDRRAQQIAQLLGQSIQVGDRVLINHAPGLEYVASFFGCLYAGAIAVPVYPPRFNAKLDRLQSIQTDASPRAALTSTSILENLRPRFGEHPALNALAWIETDKEGGEALPPWKESKPSPDAIAFIQYTSGSTSDPKGVMLSHYNLLENLRCICECFGVTKQTRAMSWLPPYHDMGLIGGILGGIYNGVPAVLMSPYAFVQRPIRWLQALSHYRTTHSGAPNFAYDLCVKRIPDEQVVGLDLSSWELAFCGAEPIRKDVLENFAKKFAPAGFRSESFYPCYGLAEATLMVSGGQKANGAIFYDIDVDKIETDGVAVPFKDPKRSRTIVGCGQVLSGHTVRIVNPQTRRTQTDGKVGEVWFSGPSVAAGYWKKPKETAQAFGAMIEGDDSREKYLRTGDLGFLKEGELFITGRIKDLLIFRGRNFYPQDIEVTVEQSHPSLRGGACACFSVEQMEEERLVVVQELHRTAKDVDFEEVLAAIRQNIFEHHGIQPYAISLIKANSMPVTSSGKIQRHASKRDFLVGDLNEQVRYYEPQSSIS